MSVQDSEAHGFLLIFWWFDAGHAIPSKDTTHHLGSQRRNPHTMDASPEAKDVHYKEMQLTG
jgi:hypothetical protein